MPFAFCDLRGVEQKNGCENIARTLKAIFFHSLVFLLLYSICPPFLQLHGKVLTSQTSNTIRAYV